MHDLLPWKKPTETSRTFPIFLRCNLKSTRYYWTSEGCEDRGATATGRARRRARPSASGAMTEQHTDQSGAPVALTLPTSDDIPTCPKYPTTHLNWPMHQLHNTRPPVVSTLHRTCPLTPTCTDAATLRFSTPSQGTHES